jgi:glutaredoxin-like protein NrdH
MADDVFVYALSTCPWCRKTRQWLEDSKIPYEWVDVDKLPEGECDEVAEKAYQLSGGRRYPVVVINGEVVVGYSPDKFLQHLKHGGGV